IGARDRQERRQPLPHRRPPLHHRARAHGVDGDERAVDRGAGSPAPVSRDLSSARATVIARSEATKQSILSLRRAMDCFAALAMTEWALSVMAGLDPRA